MAKKEHTMVPESTSVVISSSGISLPQVLPATGSTDLGKISIITIRCSRLYAMKKSSMDARVHGRFLGGTAVGKEHSLGRSAEKVWKLTLTGTLPEPSRGCGGFCDQPRPALLIVIHLHQHSATASFSTCLHCLLFRHAVVLCVFVVASEFLRTTHPLNRSFFGCMSE